ncbi:hypothetical protein CC1G_13943 [Coprinopsis cinerea okayama7|uniref:Piwi domain-containing protein n=1 Tax=Coprinopsis cinerea (strain Okayama-7 / 130 / ATCC MYA-4618 / FGSC 9003) TaxID=240176 RepID=D6RKQ1_COPC7|nr:hypothetical protein CC1G_13943 [Coprinopsis cinerea okayama7\|eukprot:XP_002911903.1 hypothetical protein CC1G_13943 [Coprinopsis cinerea okayama7\
MLKYFKGLKIRVTHPRKSSTSIKCIMGFVSDGGGFKFDFEGKMITVAQHYRTAHNVTLSHPFAPGVILRKEPHMVVVPMELCELVPNQMFKKKVPDDMAGDMVKFAAVNPSDRFQKIKLAPMVESGMVISRDPLTVEGKLLNPPMIKYDCRTQEPKNGGWNVLNQKLLKPMPMRLWAILNCEPTRISSQQAWGIAKTLADCCKALGMRIDKPPIVVKDYSGGSLSSVLDSVMQESSQILQRHGIDLRKTLKEFMLIVLLPSEAAHLRTEVKYWGDAVNGVKTQCLRFGKTMNNQYCNNVALNEEKFNAPSTGADIGHPGAGIRNKPSVSGLVFSISQFATEYAAITRIQPPRVEAIVDLEEMFRYAMDKFRKSANGLPHNIIFFRDGVSEGEFATITNTEIRVLQEVIDAFHNEISPEKPKPKLTFVAVGKRHHTLLFPPHGSNLADRKGNCHPGVAVDSGITQPFLPNFYLQSHAAIQGTSRSSHYIVLRDEVFAEYRESAILQLEELAYGLCHIYAKATRSVSIPAPVYYADLVCRRGMFHIDPRNQNVSFDDTTSIHTSGTEPPFDLEPWKNAFKPLHGALEPAMYFL